MISIDGGLKSGSGTLVRDAVALCALTGETLHLFNIRARRPRPGLRPQHLSAVRAAAGAADGASKPPAASVLFWLGRFFFTRCEGIPKRS
ncbi:RNA 3'-terminal phosphate cyclase [Desulfoglaeba alkanexedens]|uniref:RNA 3'-terminal-phosphate cyclase (ATP) n=1 Tax=Desulfoglaeba alkanexedens ALDC TaxID=980445 RepID=A0A4P8L1A8_9BACT|nr:hypothetical protein FDQ92_04725 [Desulfoglaeba alkanexedens ALDC]